VTTLVGAHGHAPVSVPGRIGTGEAQVQRTFEVRCTFSSILTEPAGLQKEA